MSNKSPSAIKAKVIEHKFFFSLLAFYCVLSTFMLDKYPRVWVDEPWESITASTFAHEGKMYNPVLENCNGFDKVLLQPRLFLSIAVAPAFAVFGIGFIQGRMVSAACGALLMIGVYLFTSKFFSKRAALFAVWFVMIETMMFISYRTIRPEIYLVTMESYSMLFLFQGMRENSKAYFFWSGLLAGVTLWTHPNAVLHVGAVGVLLLLTYRGKAFTSRLSWTFAGALLLGVAPYFVYVTVNDAQNSFSTFFLQLGDRTNAVSRQNWALSSLQGEWDRIVDYAQFPFRVPSILIFAYFWITSIVSKKKETRYIAIAISVHAFLSFLLITNKTIYYSTSVLPLLCILTASGIDELLGQSQKVMARLERILSFPFWRESAGVAVFFILSLNQIAGDANLLWRHRDCSYVDTINRLHAVIPSNARVWGSMTFWYGFYGQPFRTQYTYLRDMDSFRPEYMITGDPEVWTKESWKSIREKAEETVKLRGTLVSELPVNCYGRLRVYRLQW